jgi:anti-anti-sigma regulatory factor
MSLLTETVDRRLGLIRARGHLTRLGADLLSATADSLFGSGHTRVTLDLRGLAATDDAGLAVLEDLRVRVALEGGELVLRRPPDSTSDMSGVLAEPTAS